MKEQIMSLPFYGKVGSISKIEVVSQEDEVKNYLRYEYDANGNEKTAKIVPKRYFDKLKNNYYQDVLDYLFTNEAKFQTYQNTRLKKKINLKSLYIDLIVSSFLSCVGLGLSILSVQLAPINWVTYLSVLIFATAGTYAGVKIKEKIDYQTDQKKAQFIQHYKEYQNALNEHNMKRSQTYTPTKYQGLSHKNNPENTLKRTRVLEK